jgi:hypothetical protein
MNPIQPAGITAKRYHSVLPFNAEENHPFASSIVQFTISRLSQTPTLEAIRKPVESGHLSSPGDINLYDVISPIYKSVGRITIGDQHLGTCSLVSDDIVLVPRHCVERMNVSQIKIRFENVVDNAPEFHTVPISIEGIVEDGYPQDYVLLKLNNDTHYSLPQPILLRMERLDTPHALLHHPIGKSQQTSVHGIGTSYNGRSIIFHDTNYGSSGGALVSPTGHVVGMHLGSDLVIGPNEWGLKRYVLNFDQLKPGILKSIVEGQPRENLNVLQPIPSITPAEWNYIDLEVFLEKSNNSIDLNQGKKLTSREAEEVYIVNNKVYKIFSSKAPALQQFLSSAQIDRMGVPIPENYKCYEAKINQKPVWVFESQQLVGRFFQISKTKKGIEKSIRKIDDQKKLFRIYCILMRAYNTGLTDPQGFFNENWESPIKFIDIHTRTSPGNSNLQELANIAFVKLNDDMKKKALVIDFKI